MKTPSLGARVVVSGLAVLVILLVAVEVVVYLALRASLESSIQEALELRAAVAQRTAAAVAGPAELADALVSIGIPAEVVTPEGDVVASSPAVPRNRPGETLPVSTVLEPRESLTRPLPSGGEVTVYASRAGVDATLARLLLIEVLATIAGLAAAVVLLRRATRVALGPLDEVVEHASSTAAGNHGRRLEPTDPTTELGRLAVAYDDMLDQLEAALAEARESEEHSRRFLADAAHQLRTPLATVRASVELLLVEPDLLARERNMAHLVRETGRAVRLLNSLLLLARLDQGRLPVVVGSVDLADVCRAEAERGAALAPHLEVTFVDLRRDPEHLSVVTDDLREAIGNLVDNARRHAASEIRIELQGGDGDQTVRVTDDGPGVPIEIRDVIFDRFASPDGRGGSGLGLPIARAIAEAHEGGLDYVAGEGFVLRLRSGQRQPAGDAPRA